MEEGLRAVGLIQKIGRKVLLKNISLDIKPGEFLGVIGPSGAGKSLLLGALSGIRPPKTGSIWVDGNNLLKNPETLKSKISYVPQDDIVHTELSVFKSIYYSARLRLLPGLKESTIVEKVSQTVNFLEIEKLGKSIISTLSGGERKRVNVGTELLTDPRYIFLDEPVAGLDFRSETRLMNFLKELTTKGTTVVMSTHILNHLEKFDRVAIIAEGRLLFLGAPREALSFFRVQHPNEIYEKITKESVTEWEKKYREILKSYPQAFSGVFSRKEKRRNKIRFGKKIKKIGHQFFTLTRRLADIRLSDWKSTAVLILQAPFLAIVMSWVTKNEFIPLAFVLMALWIGCVNSNREIVKELAIYRRERAMGLNLGAYLGSKIIVIAFLCFIQSFFAVGIYKIMQVFPGDFILYFLVFYLITFVSSLMGLLISAVSHNSDMANILIPLILLPQLGYSGLLIPIHKMSNINQMLSALSLTRWGTQSILEIYLGDITPVFYEGIRSLCLFGLIFVLAQWIALRFKDINRRF